MGDKMSAIKNEIGNKYGLLTVIGRAESNKNGRAKWTCQCECGNQIDVLGVSLRKGATQSCGCLQKKRASTTNSISEIGNKYGKLTVISRDGSINGYALWRCRCECGRETVVRGVSLRNGNSETCGLCCSSKGEERIEKIFIEQNINFVRQYKIKDCKNIKTLPFDFAIFENEELSCLIEYQGRQHYEESFVFDGSADSFELRQQRDNIKRNYCYKNGIKLIEIPYTDLDKISWNYLKEKIYGQKSNQ